MSKKLVPESGLECPASPFAGIVGDVVQYSIYLDGTITLDENCWFHAWKGTQSVTSLVCPGSMAAAGNMLRTPVISNELVAQYRYVFKVLVDNKYIIQYFRRIVERESGQK